MALALSLLVLAVAQYVLDTLTIPEIKDNQDYKIMHKLNIIFRT